MDMNSRFNQLRFRDWEKLSQKAEIQILQNPIHEFKTSK